MLIVIRCLIGWILIMSIFNIEQFNIFRKLLPEEGEDDDEESDETMEEKEVIINTVDSHESDYSYLYI